MARRPRKISPQQLERIQENARRNWNASVAKFGTPRALPAKPRRRRRGRS